MKTTIALYVAVALLVMAFDRRARRRQGRANDAFALTVGAGLLWPGILLLGVYLAARAALAPRQTTGDEHG